MAKAGDMIRAARKRLLMSQKDVGDELDVDQRTVSYWEKTDPPAKWAAKLAELLELDLEELREALGERAVSYEYQPRRSPAVLARGPYAVGRAKQAEWLDMVKRDGSLSREARDLLGYLPGYIRSDERERSADSFVTFKKLAKDAPEYDEEDVVNAWSEVLDSGYVEDIGEGVKWVLRLKFPEH